MGEAKSKQLDCPAVGRRIKRQECGENRISSYDCPADCPNNPWSPNNYDRTLEIQDRCTEKLIARLRAEQVRALGYTRFPDFAGKDRAMASLQWFSDKFYRETDASGKTFWQRWKDDRCAELNNDQRIHIEAESMMRVAVLEILEICNESMVRAVDLLDPDRAPFPLLDRSLCKTACRFSTLFCVIFELPHYCRIHSVGYPLPDVPGLSARDVFMEIASHLGAPPSQEERSKWLLNNLCRMGNSFNAVSLARHEAMLNGIKMAYTRTVYEVKCSLDKLHQILEKAKDIDEGDLSDEDRDAGFVQAWDALGGESQYIKGESLLGRILLHKDDYLQLEASSSERSNQLKQRIDKLFGKHIRFSRERTDDLAAQYREKRKYNYDPALVPERLMQNITQVETAVSRIKFDPDATSRAQLDEQIEQEFMKTFLDKSIPLLDGLTPRQAAKDSARRPRLVEIMKSRVRDQDESNLRNGCNTDINWMLEELGLDEINFPPPPLRQKAVEEDFDDDNSDDDDEEFDPTEFLMLDNEQIAQGMADLDAKYPDGELVKLFKRLYPQVAKELVTYCGRQNREALDLAMDLAAHVSLIQFIPKKPVDDDLFAEDFDVAYDWFIDLMAQDTNPLDELRQPFLSTYVFQELEKQMRFGRADPLLLKLYVYLTALAEVVDKTYVEHLLKTLHND